MGIYNPGSRTTESKLPLIRKQLTNLPYFSLRVSSQLHPINPTAYLTFFWMPQRYFQIPKFTSKSWSSPYQNLLAFFQYSSAQRIAQLSIPFHKPETQESFFLSPFNLVSFQILPFYLRNCFSSAHFSPPPRHHHSPKCHCLSCRQLRQFLNWPSTHTWFPFQSGRQGDLSKTQTLPFYPCLKLFSDLTKALG